MKNGFRRFLFALLIAVFISGNLFQGIAAGGQAQPPADKAAPEVGHNPETGKVSFIGGGNPIAIPGASGVRGLSAVDKAMAAAVIYGPQFGLKDPSQELSFDKSADDGNGHAITHYQQIYQGVPVLAGGLIFNMNSNGDLLSVSGEVSSDLSLDTQPAIGGDEAGKTALGAIAKWYQVDASALTVSEPELMIYDESLLKESILPPRLVWNLEVNSTSGQPIREMVLVDAQTGGISFHANEIDTFQPTNRPSRNLNIGATTWYVSTTGNDSNDCLTSTTPCLTINGALGKAAGSGDTINVASGTYTGSGSYVVTVSKSVQILGGWDASFTTRSGQSIIDAQTARTGLYINGSGLTVNISQFTIQNSAGPYGSYGVSGNNSGGTTTFNRVALINNAGNGIRNTGGDVNFTNSTISGNHSGGTAGSAISNLSGHMNIQYSTITNNSGPSDYAIWGYSIEIGNSILAGNSIGDCYGGSSLTSDGHNIFGHSPACSASITVQPSDLVGVDPGIGSLAAGGYHPLTTASPAINAASGGCPATDQRGVTRPQGSACDIGAYEYQPGTIPAALIVYQGSPQSIQLGTAAAINFAASVVDANGAGVPGVTVTFTAPASGASGTFSGSGTNVTTVSTGFLGVATASTFTANSASGTYSVLATVSGLSSPVVFSLANLPAIIIQTYNMNHSFDESGLPGTFVCNFTQTVCTSGPDADVNHATRYAFDTYAFYQTHFHRNSINNAGMAIISSVHFGSSYTNAFWNGYQMVYGDGFPADDVVGHELTHGVTSYTSQLLYSYQSGAINESLSDVFGEFVDQTNGSGNDSPSVKWLLGEDLPGGAIRSMSDPTIFSHPDRITSPYFYTGPNDNGGVHTNSGVNNKAAFLMTDGGTFNGRTVTGIGLNKTAAVYYQVQTSLLGAAANYSDLYYALNQACLNLVGGTDGITSGDCVQVRNATEAVEMNVKPSQAYTPYPDDCAAGQSISTVLFSDNMESGTGKWSFGAIKSPNVWGLGTPGIASPAHSLVGVDYDYISDSVAAMTSDIWVPTTNDPMLYFKHYFEFDSYYDSTGNPIEAYDGGVVEYSINHGATWYDAAPLFNAGENYNGYLPTTWQNPLGGRWSFSGLSMQMVGSRYNLASLKGQSVRFRWRVGTDNIIGYLGWYIDDVKVYTCGINISGNAGVAGATLSYVDGTAKTATTDSYGNYSITVPNNWNGTVTPTHACYTFSPANTVYSNVTANTSSQDYTPTIKPGCADVNVTIAGAHRGTYGLPSAGSTRINYAGLNNGPVQVQSSNAVPIIAAERDSWWDGTEWTSYSQLMGLPAGQVSDTYVFPAYNNVSLDEQMRIGNVDPTKTSVVTVTIGGNLQATYTLLPNQSVRDNYVGVNDGPVIVKGTAGVKIIAAERDSWWDGMEWTSFAQTMGLPAGQISDTYQFPAYNNVSLDEQMRIGNVDPTKTSTVTVTIGGHLQATYTLLPNQSVRDNYVGVNDGPVVVQGTAGVKIIAAERDSWWSGTRWTSFVQTLGLPSGLLSDTYVFPAYNNVTLDEQLRFGVP